GIEKFETDLKTLHPILAECHVVKSKLELAVIQYANDISSEAHIEVMRKTKSEMQEYQLESIFLHHTYFYGSCRHCSYTCICATGDNSSVLHYGHAAAPNDRTLRHGDMALLDMGAKFHLFASDITGSFPVGEWKIYKESTSYLQCKGSSYDQSLVVDVDYDQSLILWHIATELCYNSKLYDYVKFIESHFQRHGNSFATPWVLRVEEGWSSLVKYVVDVDYDQSLILWHIATQLCYNSELYDYVKFIESDIIKVNEDKRFGYYNNGMFMLNLIKDTDDSGSIYMSSSTVVNSSLWHARINHETTTPYTQQQNGVAERKNRALKEMVNSMLSYSGLSEGFWGEATLTACYLFMYNGKTVMLS
ncbi:Xaa-Pro dipeptidase, partial [Tanacetum coccineum]